MSSHLRCMVYLQIHLLNKISELPRKWQAILYWILRYTFIHSMQLKASIPERQAHQYLLLPLRTI